MIDLFSLSTDELINLRNKIDLILSKKADTEIALFYSAICKKIQMLGFQLPPFYLIKDKKLISLIGKVFLELKSYYKIKDGDVTRLAFLFAELMVEFLTKNSIPVSLKTLFENYDKFYSLMEKEFPNYHKIIFRVDEVLYE